jgi:hypothetical protein
MRKGARKSAKKGALNSAKKQWVAKSASSPTNLLHNTKKKESKH